jgi:SAM-dependent methyltransferase
MQPTMTGHGSPVTITPNSLHCPACASQMEKIAGSKDNNVCIWQVIRCSYCGLGRTYPDPGSNELATLYKTYYTENGHVRSDWYRDKVKRALALGINHNRPFIRNLCYIFAGMTMQVVLPAAYGKKRVLDVGFGYGRLLDYFKLSGWTTFGVEPGPNAAAITKKRVHCISNGRLTPNQYEENYFSAVIMCHSLEHISNPIETLNEVYRILAPGGLLIIDVPNGDCLDAIFFATAWHAWHLPYHLFHWNSRALTEALIRIGFSIEYFKYKIPKYAEYRTNYRNMRDLGEATVIPFVLHVLKSWAIGRLGSRRSHHGHYVACYAKKPES